jgi:hypothetical protein
LLLLLFQDKKISSPPERQPEKKGREERWVKGVLGGE